jgi:hypothetical protein
MCPHALQVREAVAAGTLTESDLDQALTKTLRMRFITGQFDPPSVNPWSKLTVETVNSKEHRRLARQVVHKGELVRHFLARYFLLGQCGDLGGGGKPGGGWACGSQQQGAPAAGTIDEAQRLEHCT